ncbi:MAG: sigma 54-dependent Fis family transcriptional regulator [Polyangiaceae bacterium]|nr:sigma 54-dependent Fis family transcriptional regulator [Polyangiaceae bacterium]
MTDDDGLSELDTAAYVRPDRAALTRKAFVLRVVSGADAGRTVAISPETGHRVLVGKGPACDLVLLDPTVSRRHLALSLEKGSVTVSDLGSLNKVFVNGVCVREAELVGGERIRIGATELSLEAHVSGPTPMETASSFGCVLGGSEAMRRIYPLCRRLAAASVPLVIEGETGTGKEQLAEALHAAGPRASGPYVVFDCTAVAPNLIESELFGHEKGAFTGAVAARKGVLERAHRGTLLVDEIGDLPLELQPKLLRLLERGELTRIGGERPIKVDVRILAATRRDLDHEVARGRFRDDLFHRVAVTRIELPPLRARHGDVELLARHFAVQLGVEPSSLPSALLARWMEAPWPGNVRELRNAVARWVALGDLAGDTRAPEDAVGAWRSIPTPTTGDPIAQLLALDLPLSEARQKVVDVFELRYVERALQQHGGNVTRAAAAAGVARRHFHRLKARLMNGGAEDEDDGESA